MKTINTLPQTQNEGWGFLGTMGGLAATAWPLAVTKIAEATGADQEAVVAFLDSKYGRHFADEVHNQTYKGLLLEQAITVTVLQYMAWTISRACSESYGIPRGLPYLTGFVIQCGIDAEASLRWALVIKPDLADTHNNLGLTLHDLGRLDNAETCFRLALQINPDYAEAHSNLGNTLKDLGRLNEAEVSYRRALQIKPDLAEAHNNLSNTLQELGRLDNAEASLRWGPQ